LKKVSGFFLRSGGGVSGRDPPGRGGGPGGPQKIGGKIFFLPRKRTPKKGPKMAGGTPPGGGGRPSKEAWVVYIDDDIRERSRNIFLFHFVFTFFPFFVDLHRRTFVKCVLQFPPEAKRAKQRLLQKNSRIAGKGVCRPKSLRRPALGKNSTTGAQKKTTT